MARHPDYPKEADYERLTLEQVDAEVRRLTARRVAHPDNAYWRKLFEGRLAKLNKYRQRLLQERD